jgi:hypothetical protein
VWAFTEDSLVKPASGIVVAKREAQCAALLEGGEEDAAGPHVHL